MDGEATFQMRKEYLAVRIDIHAYDDKAMVESR